MSRRLLLGALILYGCASPQQDVADDVPTQARVAGTTQPVTYYRDVKPIIDQKCTQCHHTGGGGHFSLETYAAVKPLAGAISHVVDRGTMPPWRASGPLDQYIGDRRLTEEQKSILLGWVAQGAPEGDPRDEPHQPPPPRRGLKRVDLTLPIGSYTPKAGDDYRCFPLDWSVDQTKYITGLSIEPGDKELVHHGIVYLVQPSGVASVRRNDEADPEPGYHCMGGPGTWLTSYEPGGYGEENPGGVGFEFKPGAMLVLQMHYNTLAKTGTDATRVELTLEDHVDRVGEVDLIMNPLWAARMMQIPANATDVVHKWEGRPYGLASDGTYDLYWADLHMHTRGTSAKMGIVRANGQRENLLDIPEWSFEWQETYLFQKPVRLNPGEKLYVECHFDNGRDNQPVVNGQRLPVRDVNWGERTIDEMCLGNVLSVRVREDEGRSGAARDADARSDEEDEDEPEDSNDWWSDEDEDSDEDSDEDEDDWWSAWF